MIKLSERLLTIANMIDQGETVADIGTDHGYLPIYLLSSGKSPSAILTDISGGSLGKARINCSELLISNNYSLREGDGLEVLEPGEVDAVVMAGIGGLLTIEIIDWDLEKSRSFRKMILQPRNNSGALRKYLFNHGFSVKDYAIVPEGERFSEILLVVPEKDSLTNYSNDCEWEFPDEIVDSKKTYAKPYLEKALIQEKNVLEKILSGLIDKPSESAEKDIEYRKSRIRRIEDLLQRL